jgi:hypothetical protein
MSTHPLHTLIERTLASGQVTHHQALPEEFGPDNARGAFFRECLTTLLGRYPALRVEVSGSFAALRKLGLTPGYLNPVGPHNVGAYCAALENPGAIRLHFIRKGTWSPRSRFADSEGLAVKAG